MRHLRLERVVTRRGYVSVRRFYLYAERGLSRKHVSVWLSDGRLHIGYQDALLARYGACSDRAARRLSDVTKPEIFHTIYASSQPELWNLDDDQWLKIRPRPYVRHPRPIDIGARQLALSLLA